MKNLENRTLELIAIALSNEHSIKVIRSGRNLGTSFTPAGMPVITIPDVRNEDRCYLDLVRGYIDHEIAHIRHTDRTELLKMPDAHPEWRGALETVGMIFEDVMVEEFMGRDFPGSRKNLDALNDVVYRLRRFKPAKAESLIADVLSDRLIPQNIPYALWTAATQYILYRVRQDKHPVLKEFTPLYRHPVDALAPGLADLIEPILRDVSRVGFGTAANQSLALQTVTLASDYFETAWPWVDGGPVPDGVRRTMRSVLRDGGLARDMVDISKVAERLVAEILKTDTSKEIKPVVADHREHGGEFWQERLRDLTAEEQREALRTSAMLAASMQALLQAHEFNRTGSTHTGRLNTNSLHRLFTCNDNIFFKRIKRRRINTEIIIAIDMSGSMFNEGKDIIASKALYAVAAALGDIHGLTFSIIGFADTDVVDILCKNDRLTPRMRIVPKGTTRCGTALEHACGSFSKTTTGRKIVLMITDGDTKDIDAFREAIRRAAVEGIEVLGLGICDTNIQNYLPPNRCCVIRDTHALASEILRMLRDSLILPE